eukprot:6192073-Pyramimonas_sp.AAC.1
MADKKSLAKFSYCSGRSSFAPLAVRAEGGRWCIIGVNEGAPGAPADRGREPEGPPGPPLPSPRPEEVGRPNTSVCRGRGA